MTDPIVKTLDLPCPAAQAFDLLIRRVEGDSRGVAGR
jgi:hypothetical protein